MLVSDGDPHPANNWNEWMLSGREVVHQIRHILPILKAKPYRDPRFMIKVGPGGC